MRVCAQIITDGVRVRQIVMNGLTNAIKYSRAGVDGAIRVVVRVETAVAAAVDGSGGIIGRSSGCGPSVPASGAWLCIDVLDRGPGMRGVAEHLLFADFAAPLSFASLPEPAAVSSRVVPVGSSGIGLSICAKYVPVHLTRSL